MGLMVGAQRWVHIGGCTAHEGLCSYRMLQSVPGPCLARMNSDLANMFRGILNLVGGLPVAARVGVLCWLLFCEFSGLRWGANVTRL